MARLSLTRCVFCGLHSPNLFRFALLAQALVTAEVKTKASGDWFHPGCSRLAFAALNKKVPMVLSAAVEKGDKQ